MNAFPPLLSRHGGAALLLALGILAARPAAAHTAGERAIPAQPGWRVGAAAAVVAVDADGPVPGPRLDGQTGVGDTPEDLRSLALEHATVDVGARLHPLLGLSVAVGRHGQDPTHFEAAWVEARPAADSAWSFGLGRLRVPLGPVVTEAGHYDRFLQTPLVKRAAFHGDWIEEGGNLAWRVAPGSGPMGLDGLDLGLWRASTFPGGDGASPAPVLHLQGQAGPVRWDGFAAWMRPEGRGSFARPASGLPGVGHQHRLPDCTESLRELVCFDGEVRLIGGSLQWTPAGAPDWRFVAAGLHRDEDGQLFGRNGDVAYRGRAWGGWLEAQWRWRPGWELAWRGEGLKARNTLEGPGASLLARDAGLLPDRGSWRQALALGWAPTPSLRLSAEAGRESLAGQAQTVLALRLRIALPELLHGH